MKLKPVFRQRIVVWGFFLSCGAYIFRISSISAVNIGVSDVLTSETKLLPQFYYDALVIRSLDEHHALKLMLNHCQRLRNSSSFFFIDSKRYTQWNHDIFSTCFEAMDGQRWRPRAVIRIIILTWKRPESLLRLLRSLQNSDMLGRRAVLDIRIDAPPLDPQAKRKWDQTIEIAHVFNFAHGHKTVNVSETPQGLEWAWVNAWDPAGACGERAVILEDDLELSKLWFRIITRMWDAYENRTEIASISLQRLQIRATDGKPTEFINNHQPFLYKLLGSWGMSPHPVKWTSFVTWRKSLNSSFDPRVPGLAPSHWYQPGSSNMWTMHFIWFCQEHNLTNLYISPPDNKTFSGNYKEPGVHYSGQAQQGIKNTLVDKWLPQWNNPPLHLVSLDWNAEPETRR